jgi:hypothetical protein
MSRSFLTSLKWTPPTAKIRTRPMKSLSSVISSSANSKAARRLARCSTDAVPPKRVFIVGSPKGRDFVISEVFLNLTEKNRRGYFAANYKIYTAAHLESQGAAADTQWDHERGKSHERGPVGDSSGKVVGLIVNGNRRRRVDRECVGHLVFQSRRIEEIRLC